MSVLNQINAVPTNTPVTPGRQAAGLQPNLYPIATIGTRQAQDQNRYLTQAAANTSNGSLLQVIQDQVELLQRDGLEQRAVQQATATNPSDNPEASSIREGYRHQFEEALRERGRAQDLARTLGPGEHRLSDHSSATVKQGTDGRLTVITNRPDGSQRTVSIDGTDVNVETTGGPWGKSVHTFSKRGADVSVATADSNGVLSGQVAYSLDPAGWPVRSLTGPDFSDSTVANEDGSTDNRQIVGWRQVGFGAVPIYEQRHLAGVPHAH